MISFSFYGGSLIPYSFASVGFEGDFDPSKWNCVTNGGDGACDDGGAPSFIILTGNNIGSLANTDYIVTVVDDTRISFSFSYLSVDPDGPESDPAGYVLDGKFVQFTNNKGLSDQSGDVSIFVKSGQVFGFRVSTADGLFGAGSLRIENFTASEVTPVKSDSRGGCSDCTLPTMGVDYTGFRQVENGFTYNGSPIDVELYYTPYPLITVEVGQKNIAAFKIYENSGPDVLSHFSLAFGLGKGETIHTSKAKIEWDKAFDGSEKIMITDPENVLEDVSVKTSVVKCTELSVEEQCLLVEIPHTFRAPLEFNMVGTDMWDKTRNAWQNYFNHGIAVHGDSLNPSNVFVGIYKGELITLYETAKNHAVDKQGNNWTFDKEWSMVYEPIQHKDVPTSHGIDRFNTLFTGYKDQQEKKGLLIMQNICPDCYLGLC